LHEDFFTRLFSGTPQYTNINKGICRGISELFIRKVHKQVRGPGGQARQLYKGLSGTSQ